MTLEHGAYCEELVRQTAELRSHLSGADLAATVPTCPDWTLRDLAVHVGGAHRWVDHIVRTRATDMVKWKDVPGAGGPGSDDAAALDAWLAEGAEHCAAALREAGPDLKVWSWMGDATTSFWSRRMTHETAVHRADAAGTVGAPYTLPADVAADALDEWLGIITFVQAFKKSEAPLGEPGQSLHLHATDAPDAEWFIEIGDEGFTWRHAHEKATVALRGPLADVLRVFYRRLPADTPGVEVLGDPAVLDRWLTSTSF
ncbi:maleylpyruvate isomerase family mycothiol-dependent enzyme [Streptomyces xanthochromogenes]|uniref:maleylpyruvate isomerase family mycothiol-dependent enzyme n=1 Tax=Streptomyces xanthochromogenes TaxID=67384 RepID=UPI00379F974B